MNLTGPTAVPGRPIINLEPSPRPKYAGTVPNMHLKHSVCPKIDSAVP